jgi:hypothetical protein
MKGHCKTHWLLWDPECVCWCDGTSMDVHEQASQNGLQVKCLCGALWSSPVDFRPKMLEPQKSISTISSLGLFSYRYYPMLQTVGLDCYLLLDRGTLNIYLWEVCVYINWDSHFPRVILGIWHLNFLILPHTCTIAADEIPNCALRQNMFSRVQQ